MAHVDIIGMGMTREDLTPAHLDMIRSADALAGGKRHLSYFPEYKGPTHEITGDLKALLRFIRDRFDARKLVVLASGDPLFFGIGGYLTDNLGKENVRIHPNVTSVAAAFARLKLPWQDATVLSLHGKTDTHRLWEAMAAETKIALFTDRTHTPGWLAAALIERGITDVRMWVLEKMGSDNEQIASFRLEDAERTEFDDLNMVVLTRQEADAVEKTHNFGPGIPDDRFEHCKGLITKAEVRAVTLSKLRLAPGMVLWDLGAGSGSVSVEAALLMGKGRVVAVEKNRDRIGQIETNRKRFGIPHLQVINARLPEGLAGLPAPDRVFVGGGGKDLQEIIKVSAGRLAPAGIIVANTVLLSNVTTAMDTLNQLGFETEMVQIQVSRSSRMPWSERLQAENPVFIISGYKKT